MEINDQQNHEDEEKQSKQTALPSDSVITKDEEPTCSKPEGTDAALVSQEMPSCSNSHKLNRSISRIKNAASNVTRKLQQKKCSLQKQNVDIMVDEKETRKNDERVRAILNDLRIDKNMSEKQLHVNGYKTSKEDMPINANIAMSSKPLHQHSKKQLECLVEGLQELVRKLTMDDNTLKLKAQRLADNINGLKDFPLFYLDFDNKATKSQNRRTHNIRDAGNERNIRSDSSEKSHDSSCYAVETKTPTKKSKTKTRKEISPQEHFLNYINSIITEYMETEEKNQTKIMCTPQNLEDLENFAQLLVSIGIGRVVEEEIRVNRKNNRQAFISLCSDREGLGRDGIVLLPVARRYAFDGDIVRAFVLNPKIITNKNEPEEDGRKTRKISSNILGGKESSICLADDEDLFDEYDSSPDTDNDDSPDITAIISENCPKAFVINIVKQTELREVVGSVSFKKTCTLNSKIYYKLKPHDMKVPMVYIPANSCQDHINAASKDDVVGMLFLAHVLETDVNGRCIGELLHPIGKVGNLEAEMKAILLHNGLKDLKPYDQKFYDMYDGPVPPVTDDDLRQREDLRKICVFTIDPLTARDLDDAVSVEKLSENDYEIGVHISDVSHYLEENSELDNLVKERATSIYLVNEVIHMLPTSLCFRCSLLPGEDKFAFSVFWRWNEKDKTFSEPRFTRTVINSCTQFAYEHAQKIIDYPEESFCRDDFPEILNNFSPDDIKGRILLLYSISRQLKSKRYDSGALSINNPKLRFSLDPLSGEPISYEVEGRKEANYLIEEFMLLANQAVAKFIHQHFPDISILRNHAPPLQKSMRALRDRLANLDLDFDITSSKSIYESIQRLSSQADDREAMEAALNVLLTKPMARARYYCSEGRTTDADFWHYALSIPIYTHFTSPIRRYPDILVHRVLAASLNYCSPPTRTAEELHQLAKICNDQKSNAKNAGDESIDHFFIRYIRSKESITLRAVVTDIFKHMLNVVSIQTGHTFAINYKLQKVIVNTAHVPSYVLVSEKNSHMPPVKLQLFSTVNIRVVLRNNKTCAFIVSPDKKARKQNSKESSKMREKNPQNNNAAKSVTKIHDSATEVENLENKAKRMPTSRKKDRVYAVKSDE